MDGTFIGFAAGLLVGCSAGAALLGMTVKTYLNEDQAERDE